MKTIQRHPLRPVSHDIIYGALVFNLRTSYGLSFKGETAARARSIIEDEPGQGSETGLEGGDAPSQNTVQESVVRLPRNDQVVAKMSGYPELMDGPTATASSPIGDYSYAESEPAPSPVKLTSVYQLYLGGVLEYEDSLLPFFMAFTPAVVAVVQAYGSDSPMYAPRSSEYCSSI